MVNYLVRLLLVGVTVYILPNFLSGIYISSVEKAILVAFVMSVLNGVVKPVLVFLSLPITILTLGLFYLVVTAAIVYICDYLVEGFKVNGFLNALLFSFILSIVNSAVGVFQKGRKK